MLLCFLLTMKEDYRRYLRYAKQISRISKYAGGITSEQHSSDGISDMIDERENGIIQCCAFSTTFLSMLTKVGSGQLRVLH